MQHAEVPCFFNEGTHATIILTPATKIDACSYVCAGKLFFRATMLTFFDYSSFKPQIN